MNARFSSYIVILLFLIHLYFSQISIATSPDEIQSNSICLEYHNVSVYSPAVAQTENG